MRLPEAVVAGCCLAAWLLTAVFAFLPSAALGTLRSPTPFFAGAAALGWLAGNMYVARRRAVGGGWTVLLSIYLGGPPGLVWLPWFVLPAAERLKAPLVPWLALGIYLIFFLVPITFRGIPRRR